jgi:ribonuclease HII
MIAMIVGIDEVGRGPWAGPLVFGAVVLGDIQIDGLTDSKKLSKKRREVLAKQITKNAKSIGLGWVTSVELDEMGMSQALTVGCRRALEQISAPYEQIILDGTVNLLKDTGKGPYVTTMAKADLLIPSVSAASIVAKVARDQFMSEQDKLYPGYGFAAHAGYGTASHRMAIERLGVSEIHRKSFAPIAALVGKHKVQKPASIEVTTKAIGDKAEDKVESYLKERGYHIKARNWRTKISEVDIVAEKNSTIFFVEVKYRRSVEQGGGMAAITTQKLKHMERAAKLWFQKYGQRDGRLVVVEVSGPQFEITEFLVLA